MYKWSVSFLIIAVAGIAVTSAPAEETATVGIEVLTLYSGQPWIGGTIPAMQGVTKWESAQYGNISAVADCRNGSLSSHGVLHGMSAKLSLLSLGKDGAATIRIVAHANHINQISTEHMQGCDGQVVNADVLDVDRTIVVGDSPVTVGELGPLRIVARKTTVIF
ncbi:hypothetical protein SAMN05414139_02266 [Burkholderia sp. D7]|nr:hypothetical protein SAMN05414139_02266 [Burkholderia sp. D7]